MKRVLTIAAVAALWAARAGGQESVFDLSMQPAFEPGERVTIRKNELVAAKFVADGQAVYDRRQKLVANLEQQVLSAQAGSVGSFRTAIIEASQVFSTDDPQAGASEVSVGNVWATASLRDSSCIADTTSLASSRHDRLSAQQLALVKRLLIRHAAFEGYSRGEAILMPDQPVAVGAEWTPSGQSLRAWIESKPALAALDAGVQSASFRLASVKNGVATIHGIVRMAAEIEGAKLSPTINVLLRMDTATGRWLSRISRMTAQASLAKGQSQTLVVEREEILAYERPATPASAPAEAHDLGWPAPAKDGNSYLNAQAGLSLDLPKDFLPAGVEMIPPMVAAFAAGGASVTVSAKDLARPIEMDELADAALRNLQDTIADYRPEDRRTLALADNVPAVLLKGRQGAGNLTVLTIVAVDGTRLASVTAVSSGDAATADKLEKVLTSLRVFEPQLVDRPQRAAKGQ